MENTTQNNYHIKELTPEEAVAIYRDNAPSHFPADELKPVSTVKLLFDMKAYLGLGLYGNANTPETSVQGSKTEGRSHQENLLGYALFLTPPDMDTVLLDYYAILEEYRDSGFGSIFLQGMKDHFKDIAGILIETEDPAFASDKEEALLRNRRNAFYYKNGVHPTNVFCTLFGVPFQIHFMPTGPDFIPSSHQATSPRQTSSTQHATGARQTPTSESLDDFVRSGLEATYRFMLPDEIYEQNVKWQ